MQIVHLASPGQLCNKLFSTASVYAHTRAAGWPLATAVLGDAVGSFVLDAADIGFFNIGPARKRVAEAICQRLPTFSLRFARVIGWYFLNNRAKEDLTNPSPRLRAVLGCHRARLLGYRYRDWAAVWAARDHLRRQFALSPGLLSQLDEYWSGVPEGPGKVMGLHVRRRDYREWHGGKYYLEWGEYRAIAERVLAQDPGIGRIVVTSNEPCPEGIFDGLPVSPGPGSAVLDLYALSRCDYICGPPSTYSLWAAFMGDRAICHVAREQSVGGEIAMKQVSQELLASSFVL